MGESAGVSVQHSRLESDSRQRFLGRLRRETFDVLILGGGINGAGMARDLALRAHAAGVPLSVAVVEQNHFASRISGRNSQLIHGGLRYLKYMQFGPVREALRERATLLRMAPRLVSPLPFLIPIQPVRSLVPWRRPAPLRLACGFAPRGTSAPADGARGAGRGRRLP